MVSARDEERAVQLAREAVELVDAGHREAAARNIREALSLAPNHPDVKSAFVKVRQEDEAGHPLLDLCRRYTSRKDETAGKDAALYLRTEGLKPPEDVALDCLKLLLTQPPLALSSHQDEIISGLVRHSAGVRRYFSTQLQESATTLFDDIYDRGDGAAVCLDTVVLDPTVWPSEERRSHCESELFQLFIAKLMESGHDLDGRSLKGITRLLVVDAAKLQHLVSDEELEVILSSTDRRLPLEVRSQATLAIAKYLEASKETGEASFSRLVAAKIAKNRNDDLIVAFSAVAAVFPIVPTVAASVFLSEHFAKVLMTTSLPTRVAGAAKSHSVELAVLDVLNAACIDRACRESVSKDFCDWLSHILTNGSDESSELAAVVLAKVRASESDTSSADLNGKVLEEDHIPELVERFKGLMAKRTFEHISTAMEGLAYSSVKPAVKEQLAGDASFLHDLIKALETRLSDSSVVYGGLMIVLNLTRYLPNLSEEQKKMAQLKAYANAAGSSTAAVRQGPNALDEDDRVAARCDAVIRAGIMPLLVDCGKIHLASIQELISKILLALSKNRQTRGTLAQQGAVKLLLTLSATNLRPDQPDPAAQKITQDSAHALARILISVNPAHVFSSSGFPQITSAIRPLVALLGTSPSTSSSSSASPVPATFTSDEPRDLLPIFESLLALTNLASYPDETAATTIVRQAWALIEDLLLSPNKYIQRAACELVCNLMTCEAGVVQFADASQRAAHRLHILLALTDAEDSATRKAAGGALAMLTEYDAAITAVLDRPRGVPLLLNLCQDQDAELVHRGVVCVRNMTCGATGEIAVRARDAVRQSGGVEMLKRSLQKTTNPDVLQAGVEALKPLVEECAG